MATYTLSGSGTQALSANVTALHITATTLPPDTGVGHANPINYFGLALLRLGDGVGFGPVAQVDASPAWVAVATGATQLGYACLNGSALSVVEVIGTGGGGGGVTHLDDLADVVIASPVNGQVLTYNSSVSLWQNAGATGGGGATLACAQYVRNTGDYSTSSTTFVVVDATNLTLSLTLAASHRVMIVLNGSAAVSSANQELMLDVAVDGSRMGGANGLVCHQVYTSGGTFNTSFTTLTPVLGIGTHTFQLQYRVSGATGTLYGNVSGANTTPLQFTALETGAST